MSKQEAHCRLRGFHEVKIKEFYDIIKPSMRYAECELCKDTPSNMRNLWYYKIGDIIEVEYSAH